MYLSTLLIDVGTNPDRPRPGRLWLRNMYHVHQRLCMAFPSRALREDDPFFLKPFSPDGFQHVHGERNDHQSFLFRVDPLAGGRAVVLVQSAVMPDWEYAFCNAGYLLEAPPQVRPFDREFVVGERLRFRLLANPVRRVSRNSLDSWGKPFDERWIGKEVPVPTAELPRWLERRSEPGWTNRDGSTGNGSRPGFRLLEFCEPQAGYVSWSRTRDQGKGQRLRSARFDGVLEVTVASSFRTTVLAGIGPGKAFGCGLLSIVPMT